MNSVPLTEKQKQTMEALRMEAERCGEPVSANVVSGRLGIAPKTVYDRFRILGMYGLVGKMSSHGKHYYYPTDGNVGGWEFKHDHPRKYKAESIERNPITAEEVRGIMQKMQYRSGETPGTKVRMFLCSEMVTEKGKMISRIIEVEAEKPYRHGVLFSGHHFIRWADIAIFMRDTKRPIGMTRRVKE